MDINYEFLRRESMMTNKKGYVKQITIVFRVLSKRSNDQNIAEVYFQIITREI